MTTMNNEDPYLYFNLPQNASDDDVQAAFHKKMKEGSSQDITMAAYIKIRNQAARTAYKWNNITSFVEDPYASKSENNNYDLEAIIKELAFLSDWEVKNCNDG